MRSRSTSNPLGFSPFLRRAALASCLLGSPALFAQAGDSGSQATPTFRVQSREVVLDVVVTDRQGNFVNGLKKEDFMVLEDKAAQRIVSFQAPSEHVLPESVPEVRSTADLRRIGNAPVTILVLDELNTAFTDMAYARGALQKWLDSQPERLLQPTVLMVASDEKFATIHDFTQDRGALLQALKQHFPSYPYRASKGGTTGPDAGTRLGLSLGTLTQISQASSGTPGRKNVIWVGVGFPQLLLDDVSGTKEEEISNAARRVTDIMLKARVTLNVIDPTAMPESSLDLNTPEVLSIDTLQSVLGPTSGTVAGVLNFDTFAPATGGRLFAGRNDVSREIAQAVSNGSNYYTLSYPPTNHDETASRFRSIHILMRDPNLLATTRTGYFPEARTQPGTPPPAPTTHDLTFDLTSAALSSVTYFGLNVDGQADSHGFELHVRTSDLQPHDLPDGKEVAEVTVMRVCFGNKNKVLSHDVAELRTSLSKAGSAPGMTDFTFPEMPLPKGTERTRFVIRDAVSGHIGTVDVKP